MERVFLSFHFDEAGKNLANLVQDLLAGHGVMVVTGDRLGGEELTQEIKNRIDQCDALICLFTARSPDQDRDWVRGERAYADVKNKRIISMVQTGVEDGGFFGNREQIRYDTNDLLPAFLKLSSTIGKWRRESGRFVTAVLKPSDVSANIHNNNAKLKYRTWIGQEATAWRDAVCQRSGYRETKAFFKNVKDDAQIEVKLNYNDQTWESGASDQLISIHLEAIDET